MYALARACLLNCMTAGSALAASAYPEKKACKRIERLTANIVVGPQP